MSQKSMLNTKMPIRLKSNRSWSRRLLFCGLRTGVIILCLLTFCQFTRPLAAGETTGLSSLEKLRLGQKIYLEQCAECHGKQGEGVKSAYEQPLIGDRSVKSLAKLITKTMPEGDEESCVGESAHLVADYIYLSFYSTMAQARINPPRVEFSRLTVEQYRNSLADMFTPFQFPAAEPTGLKALYFKNANFKKESQVIERVDPQVDFFLDPETEEGKSIGDEEWAMRWVGSVVAPETGQYDFILDTPHGVRLWVNDRKTPFIDGWVASGDQKPTASIYLLAGRAYPIRVDVHKRKNEKGKPLPSRMKLQWKPPHRLPEVIPTRFLLPVECKETLVVGTPFPPDDQSMGYVRGNAVSKEWDQATTNAALDVVRRVVASLPEYVNSKADAKDYQDKCQKYCEMLAKRALRRPLEKDEVTRYVGQHFQQAGDTESAVKRSILHILKSPYFLYRGLNDESSAFVVASNLSFTLWDTIPDEPLFEAAKSGQLRDKNGLHSQVQRMVADRRTKTKLKQFLLTWLKVDHFADLSKDEKYFPKFDKQLVADLHTSLELFLDNLLNDEKADFRQLITSRDLFLNKNLTEYYGIEFKSPEGFQKHAMDATRQAGLITHPYLMAGFAYRDTGSPIHRGVFLARMVLGRRLKPPAAAITPLAPDLHPDLSTRERVAIQTKGESCSGCHVMINGLGFTLENFDAVGRYRTEENGKPVDVSGSYETTNGEIKEFKGVRELAQFLSNSDEVHSAFVDRIFHHFVKQPLLAHGLDRPQQLRRSFAAGDFNMYSLLADVAETAALHGSK